MRLDDKSPADAMFFAMLRIRMIEEEISARYGEQEMRCPVHLSIGQEATAVGVCDALEVSDKIYSTHRCHAHYLAKGGDLKKMTAELYGKAAGCLGGRGGSMHLADPDRGMTVSIPIVASAIPLAVGSALADRLSGQPHVSIAFVGDASVEEGVFHESANFASLRRLPVLFACEHNHYSVYTHVADRQPDRPLTNLAAAHAMAVEEADGNDVGAVRAATARAVARARAGDGPTFLLFQTYRWREHCGPNYDNHLGYRTEAEFQQWKERDPLARERRRLVGLGQLNEGEETRRAGEIEREIAAAFDFAKKAALPTPDQAMLHVYA